MLKKLLITFQTIILFFSLSAYDFNTKYINQKKEIAQYTDSNGIADNGVYFIRNVGNNQLIDIPNSNYATGTEPITYTAHYNGNQRYVLTRQYNNTYRIQPLFSQDYLFYVSDNLNNTKLKLETEHSLINSLDSDKFIIERYGSQNKFYIKTRNNFANKVLTVQNKDSSTGSKIVQETIPTVPNNINYYLWEFVKTDSLNIYCPDLVEISKNSYKNFNVRVPYNVPYIFSNDGASTYMSLIKNSTGETIWTTNVGETSKEYKLLKNTDYSLRVYNTGSLDQVIVKMEPSNPTYSYGIFDTSGYDVIDMYTPLFDTKSYYEQFEMYPIFQSNLPINRIINPNDSGFVPINCEYVTILTHGEPGYILPYDGIEDNYNDITPLYAQSLPTNISSEFIFWINCYSATNSSGSYPTNMAKESVRKGSSFALGFNGSIPASHSYLFVEKIAEAISLHKTGYNLVKEAFLELTSDLSNEFNNYPNNPIFRPYVYFKSGNNVVYSIVKQLGYTVYDADTDEIIYDNQIRNQTNNLEIANRKTISYYGEKYNVISTKDYYTTIIYDENQLIHQSNIDSLISSLTRIDADSNLHVCLYNGEYHIFERIVTENDVLYYSHFYNKYVDIKTYIDITNNQLMEVRWNA